MKQECPKCKCTIDTQADCSGEDNTPVEGDLSICFKCATLMTFDKDLKLELISSKDLEGLKTINPEGYKTLITTVDAVKATIADRNKHLN